MHKQRLLLSKFLTVHATFVKEVEVMCWLLS